MNGNFCKEDSLSMFIKLLKMFITYAFREFIFLKSKVFVKQLTLHLQNYEHSPKFDRCIYICIYIGEFSKSISQK